jgi:3-oxoacyl-[acyl-carrier protein] reductase
MARFTDQTAIVTGGASGIGLATAQRLAKDGAKVILWDRDADALATAAEQIGAGTKTVALDVTDADAVTHAASAAGPIHILVASAGITGPNVPVKDYPTEAWRQVFDVNIHGVFYCNRAVVPVMLAGGYGRIVNIASVAGKEGNPNASAYSASKAAVIGLTKSLGKELATTGIRVNCVTPAAVRTAIFDQMTQAHIDFMLSKIPMGRFGTVDEVASMICFLASEECAFTTGAAVDVSGGRATY